MTYTRDGATVAATMVLAAALLGCPGSSSNDCARLPGCAQGACCTAATVCTADVCQGVTWTCRSTGNAYAWQQGDTTGQCSPPPDFGSPPDSSPGGDTTIDVTTPDHGQPTPDTSADGPKQQGTKCSQSGVSFDVSPALVKCTTVTVRATASTGYAWVLTGIDSPSGGLSWRGNASVSGSYTWTFTNVQVPCNDGPFTLKLMKDAVNDDSSKGTVVAACQP